jgi:putative DNA primase/helicase
MLDGRKGANGAADDPDFDPGEAQPIDLQTLPLMIVELITHGTLDGVKIRKRGPHFMRVVRRLHKFGFASALTLLAEHPNGVQGKYIEGGRLETELRRVWDKVETLDNRPTIVVSGGKRHENADAGIDALQQAESGLYRRDKQLARVAIVTAKGSDGALVKVPSVAVVGRSALGRSLGQTANWVKPDKFGDLHAVDPPDEVARQIIEMFDEWPFPELLGVIATPTMRPDGSLIVHEGYDRQTGVVLVAAPPMPPIPEYPTEGQAQRALEVLDGLLDEFPFVVDPDDKRQSARLNPSRSVALSAMITPVVRAAMPVAPAHLIDAPSPGTGKSYLCDLISAIAVGDRCAVIAMAPNPEETEKRLIGAALAGHPIITLDNCREIVAGEFICQVIERPVLELRPLGTSEMRRIRNSFTVLVNGNNATVAADVVRRILRAALDADMENPEERKFKGNPFRDVISDRGTYIAAALTVCRAYVAAGRPGVLSEPSFEAWSELVRSALVWLGKPDPLDTVASLRVKDPERETRAKIFETWLDLLGCDRLLTASELMRETAGEATQPEVWWEDDRADKREAFRGALLAVAADFKDTKAISTRRLGRWLTAAENTICGGHKLVVDRHDETRVRYTLRSKGV